LETLVVAMFAVNHEILQAYYNNVITVGCTKRHLQSREWRQHIKCVRMHCQNDTFQQYPTENNTTYT